MLVGHWTLDDGAGTTAADASGNNNPGTLNGPTWATGKIGGALAFDGINDYVLIGDPAILRPASALTLAAWVYLDDASVTRCVIAKDDDAAPGTATYLRYQAGGRIGCAVGGTQLLATAGIVAGQWYHFACTYDGLMVSAYVNGVLKGSVAKTGAIADEIGVSWLLGARRPANPAILMKGRLDDVRIYDAALSAAEVVALYDAATPPPPPPPPFQTPSQWATFDPSAHGVGTDPKGYNGTVVAGQYIYFIPFLGRSEFLRYDTTLPFDSLAAWAAFDPQPPSGGGYAGAGAFDGRYLYFAPWGDGITSHGEVLRYDTTLPFDDPTAWTPFSPVTHGVGVDPRGYWGAYFDGQYVFFAPESNGSGQSGEVLRYDTTAPFTTAASWLTYDPSVNGVGTDANGYKGMASDGRYLYFVPYHNGSASHGEILRYDRTAALDSAASWATYTPGAHGIGVIAKGFEDAIFDGRYLYFVPSWTSTTNYHGEVLRFDTQAPFNVASSWTAFDPGSAGVGVDPDGYNGGVFDGRYVYFVPTVNGTSAHGEVLRYDTTLPFGVASSWLTFIPGANGVGTDPRGYAGAAFVGPYLYFAPNRKSGSAHGEVLRYDTAPPLGA